MTVDRAQNILQFRRINMHGTKSGPHADPDYEQKYHPGHGSKVTSELAGDDLPRTLKSIVDSDRYVLVKKEKTSWGSENYVFRAKGTDDWVLMKRSVIDPDTGKEFFRDSGWYNPELVDAKVVRDKWGSSTQLDLKEGWSREIPAVAESGIIFRGMSAEEYDAIQRTGKIESSGDWNLTGQERMTLYTTNPDSAVSYANSFAPVGKKATPEKPAYVIAIRDPGSVSGIPGTSIDSTHERGVIGSVSKSNIVAVYEGMPYLDHGVETEVVSDSYGVRDGSGSLMGTAVAWRKIKP